MSNSSGKKRKDPKSSSSSSSLSSMVIKEEINDNNNNDHVVVDKFIKNVNFSNNNKNKKMKKSNINHIDDENSNNNNNNDDDFHDALDYNEDLKVPSLIINTNNISNGNNDDSSETFGWSPSEINTLLENVQKLLPKTDFIKYITTFEKMDWEKVKFGNRDANECKSCILNIMKKLRRFRTATEMISDAFEWQKSPWRSMITKRITHSGLPKKPRTAYLRYYQEKCPKLMRKNPELSVVDLAKICAEKFSKLSDRKRAKYQKGYEKEMIEYREKIELFKKEHPGMFKNSTSKSKIKVIDIGPKKPRTPYQIFKESSLKKLPPEKDPKSVSDASIRESWNSLSDKKRYKYIRKSLKDERRYKDELEQFLIENPEYEPPELKQLLTKGEYELKCRFEGMPERPPNSGYMLFSQIMLKELTDVPAKEKMVLIAKRWREMNDSERSKYNDDANRLMNQYIIDFDQYLSKLSDEEKDKVISEQKFKFPNEKKIQQQKSNNNNNNSNKRNKLILEQQKISIDATAMMAFQMEEIKRLQSELSNDNDQKSKQNLMKLTTERWKSMNDEQKSKYINLAKSLQDFMPDNKTLPANNTIQSKIDDDEKYYYQSGKNKKLIKFSNKYEKDFFCKTGIKKPRPAGFSLFCHKILTEKIEIPTRDRLKLAAEKWKQMSDNDKKLYCNLSKKRFILYKDLLRKFNKKGQLPNEDDKKFLGSTPSEIDEIIKNYLMKQEDDDDDEEDENCILNDIDGIDNVKDEQDQIMAESVLTEDDDDNNDKNLSQIIANSNNNNKNINTNDINDNNGNNQKITLKIAKKSIPSVSNTTTSTSSNFKNVLYDDSDDSDSSSSSSDEDDEDDDDDDDEDGDGDDEKDA